MTSPTPSADQLATAVGLAVPYERQWRLYDYSLAVRTVGVPVAAAYRTGGVEAAAQAAYAVGYRAGEHAGQFDKAGWFQTVLDANLDSAPREPLTAARQWLADTATHARGWVVDADGDVTRARNPHVPTGDVGPALRQAAPHQDDGGLPRVAAAAYTQGFDLGEQRAREVTERAIVGYAYRRASELGVSLAYVDQTLHRQPGDRPAGLTEPATLRTRSAAEVSRLSFPRPASSAAQPQPAPAGAPGRAAGTSKGRHR